MRKDEIATKWHEEIHLTQKTMLCTWPCWRAVPCSWNVKRSFESKHHSWIQHSDNKSPFHMLTVTWWSGYSFKQQCSATTPMLLSWQQPWILPGAISESDACFSVVLLHRYGIPMQKKATVMRIDFTALMDRTTINTYPPCCALLTISVVCLCFFWLRHKALLWCASQVTFDEFTHCLIVLQDVGTTFFCMSGNIHG